MTWGRFWFGALSLILAAEFWTVAHPATGDTLSENIIPMVFSHPLVWTGTLSAWLVFVVWFTWHIWHQYRERFRR